MPRLFKVIGSAGGSVPQQQQQQVCMSTSILYPACTPELGIMAEQPGSFEWGVKTRLANYANCCFMGSG